MSLKWRGYQFNEKGILVNFKTRIPYQFTSKNEDDAVFRAVTEEIYDLLESRYKLRRLELKSPNEPAGEFEYSFLFGSQDFDTKRTLLILVNGGNDERAGVWSKRALMDQGLLAGSQLPYIQNALNLGWGVLVLNPNENKGRNDKRELKYSRTSELHVKNSWFRFVSGSANRTIYFVAHGSGGLNLAYTMDSFFTDSRPLVISLADSTYFHSLERRKVHPFVLNWVTRSTAKYKAGGRNSATHANVVTLSAGTKNSLTVPNAIMRATFHVMQSDPDDRSIHEIISEAETMAGELPEEMPCDRTDDQLVVSPGDEFEYAEESVEFYDEENSDEQYDVMEDGRAVEEHTHIENL